MRINLQLFHWLWNELRLPDFDFVINQKPIHEIKILNYNTIERVFYWECLFTESRGRYLLTGRLFSYEVFDLVNLVVRRNYFIYLYACNSPLLDKGSSSESFLNTQISKKFRSQYSGKISILQASWHPSFLAVLLFLILVLVPWMLKNDPKNPNGGSNIMWFQ